MKLPAAKLPLTAEEYLALERAAEVRHEFVQGEIFAMSGASREHNLITINTAASLHSQLKNRPCEVYANDMRVKISARGDYVYPDIVAVWDTPRLEDQHLGTLLNPTLIVEVLSDSTEAYDRGLKFAAYRDLPSLREYVLIAQDRPHIDYYVRQDNDQWLLSSAVDLTAVLELPALGCRLELAEVYARIAFE